MMAPNGSLDLMFGRGRASNNFSSSPPPQSAGLKAISQLRSGRRQPDVRSSQALPNGKVRAGTGYWGAYLGACSTAGTCRRLRKPQLISADTSNSFSSSPHRRRARPCMRSASCNLCRRWHGGMVGKGFRMASVDGLGRAFRGQQVEDTVGQSVQIVHTFSPKLLVVHKQPVDVVCDILSRCENPCNRISALAAKSRGAPTFKYPVGFALTTRPAASLKIMHQMMQSLESCASVQTRAALRGAAEAIEPWQGLG
jgi:hypothetical protein